MVDEPNGDGRPPKRRERQDALDNRQSIIEAAQTLFAERGVDAVSMFEIGRAAGVGQGTLYRHFEHKGALCRALLREDVEAFRSRLDGLLDGPEAPRTAVDRLDLLLVEKIALTDAHLPLFAAIDESAAGQRRTEMYRGPLAGWLRERLVRLLEEASAAGELPPVDADFVASAILAVTSPSTVRHLRIDRGYSVDRIVAGTRGLFTGTRT